MYWKGTDLKKNMAFKITLACLTLKMRFSDRVYKKDRHSEV